MTPQEQRDLDAVLSLSDEEVAAELRAAGADPTAVGKAGAAIALLAVRNHRLSARISALESELAEKTARRSDDFELLRSAMLEHVPDGYLKSSVAHALDRLAGPELHRTLESRTPVALDRGEAAGELAAAIREVEVQCDDMSDAVALVADAARSWAALQWREPSTAPVNQCLLVRVRECFAVGFYSGLGWLVRYLDPHSGNEGDWTMSTVAGWLPLDALPALPSEPVKP